MNNQAIIINEESIVKKVVNKITLGRLNKNEEDIEKEVEYAILDDTDWKAVELDTKEYYTKVFSIASSILKLIK